jgi:hypothetical protein
MNPSKLFNFRSLAYLVLAGVVVLTPSKGLANTTQRQEQQQAQQPPPQQNPQPSSQQPTAQQASRQRKVWTNEDLILLRTPADIYLLEKEAREAAEAEADAAKIAAEGKPVIEAPLEIKLPTSIAETQLLLKNKEQEAAEKQAALTSLKAELSDTPLAQQPTKQKEIDTLAADLERAEKERKALQDNLEQLNKPPGATTPPPISAPPPPDMPPSP